MARLGKHRRRLNFCYEASRGYGLHWLLTGLGHKCGAKYPAAPLLFISVAALLPRTWSIRLLNRNTEKLSDADIDWADLVLTGGMLPQQSDTLDIIDLFHAREKPVVVGGPGVTSSPHIYQDAEFRYSVKPRT